jgi:signal transduction histidine kinase
MRIGREAIANAVRHADPSNLAILLHFEGPNVRLTIQDDGIGFVKSGDLLGFGLRGMRNRAADIKAILEIDSRPQHGTRVVATVELPAEATVASSLKHTLKYISERAFHADQEP